jgi:hypothetical protein
MKTMQILAWNIENCAILVDRRLAARNKGDTLVDLYIATIIFSSAAVGVESVEANAF